MEYGLDGGLNTFFNLSKSPFVNEKQTNTRFSAGINVRFINAKSAFTLKNIEAGFEYYSGYYHASEYGPLGGSGNFTTDVNQKKICFSLSDYFVNFRALNKSLQIGFGLNLNYAVFNNTVGYYGITTQKFDSSRNTYYWQIIPKPLQRINSPEMYHFQGNIAFTAVYNSIKLRHWSLKPRLTMLVGFTPEMKRGTWYFPFRQRLEIAFSRKLDKKKSR
jgi:hypothetical protein